MKRFVIPVMVVLGVMALMAPAFAQPTNDDLAAATGVTSLPFTETLDDHGCHRRAGRTG